MKSNSWKNKEQEILDLKKQIQDLKDSKDVEQFAIEFSKNLGLIFSQIPFDKWPEYTKAAFEYAENKFPYGASIYKKRREFRAIIG